MSKKQRRIEIESQIDRYVNGELSQEEAENLWVEIVQDQEYIDYLETTANLNDVVRHGKTEETASKNAWIYAAAAAIIMILVVIGAMRLGYFNQTDQIRPIDKIELDYYRAAEDPATLDGREKIIRNALSLFNKGQFDAAVDLLNEERNSATEADWIAKLDITLGTLFYNTDKFNNAAYYFKEVINSYKDQVEPLTLEKAYWYLGNSYFQMDMLEEAQIAMEKAYQLNGAYSRVAKSYLDAMASVERE